MVCSNTGNDVGIFVGAKIGDSVYTPQAACLAKIRLTTVLIISALTSGRCVLEIACSPKIVSKALTK